MPSSERVDHVVGLEPVCHLCAEGGDRLGDEVDGQPVVVRPLPIAVRIGLAERAGRDAGGHQAQHQPGEYVGHVEQQYENWSR